MKNRRIEVRLGRTINMGDFESARIDIGLEADISDSEELNDAYCNMYDEVKKHIIVYSKAITDKKEQGTSARQRTSRSRG